METPYRAVSFAKHQIIDESTMDQLQSNNQWIHDNTPRGRYYRYGSTPKDTQTVLICGRALIRRNRKSDSARVGVRFGRAFHPTCRPSVTTGVVADFQRKIFCTVHGPEGINLPTSSGFEISINIAADRATQDSIRKSFWVHWAAFGFRRDDMNEF